MKKLIAVVLMMMLVLSGCSKEKEVKGAGLFTETEIMSVVYRAVEEHEGQSKPNVTWVSWAEEKEVVKEITQGLYNIAGKYEWNKKIYEVRMLMHKLPNDKYELLTYKNVTTGTNKKQ